MPDVALAAATAYAADDKPAAADKEKQFIAVLQSDAPPADKAIPCKQLAIYGDKEAVPSLAPLLADKDLASWARIALEAIPGPEADEALTLISSSLAFVCTSFAVFAISLASFSSLAGRISVTTTDVFDLAVVSV